MRWKPDASLLKSVPGVGEGGGVEAIAGSFVSMKQLLSKYLRQIVLRAQNFSGGHAPRPP